jgi:hypothetical protein
MNQGNIYIYIYIYISLLQIFHIYADIPWAMLPILCVFYLKKLMWVRTRYLWELHVYIKHDSPPLGYNPCVAAISPIKVKVTSSLSLQQIDMGRQVGILSNSNTYRLS